MFGTPYRLSPFQELPVDVSYSKGNLQSLKFEQDLIKELYSENKKNLEASKFSIVLNGLSGNLHSIGAPMTEEQRKIFGDLFERFKSRVKLQSPQLEALDQRIAEVQRKRLRECLTDSKEGLDRLVNYFETRLSNPVEAESHGLHLLHSEYDSKRLQVESLLIQITQDD